jgi:phenylacetic acid degradation operon negative regulatory protein
MLAAVDALLDAFHARTPIRAGSLIVTVFGDAIAPRGGRIALASLTEILAAFRVSESLTRTALSRLVAEGWLERWKTGRTSHYRLSVRGREAFAEAARHIYGRPDPAWDGAFALALLDPAAAPERARYRAGLEARGFGALSPDLLVAPRAPAEPPSGALLLAASPGSAEEARRLAARAWPLADLGARYDAFLREFSGVAAALDEGGRPDGVAALVVRVLLVHAYRRIVLRDPFLPAALLPEPWPGATARALCGRIYRAVSPAAEAWLDAHAVTEDGPLPAAQATRFG